MESPNTPKSLVEVLDLLKDDLVKRYPNQAEWILETSNNVPSVIETHLRSGKTLDEICSFFAYFEKHHFKDVPPALLNEIRAIRIQLGQQIREGNIVLPTPK